jgi:phosphatidylglycerophosphate synthase
MLDRYADSAVVVALTLGYAAGHPGALPWLGGFAASTGFLLASYSTKEFALRHGAAYPNDWLARLKHRDLRVFVIFCGGLIGYPFHAMVAVGVLTHVLILGILCKGWALPHARPGQGLAASTDVRPATAAPRGIEAPSESV